ncbi:hypothetical protein [Novosphingobium profundi]|uniref:hypothetical protein n=1 Tax=Novosphingobium profundi TaxID=1774954 RepID=UPI001CFD99AE|nr:hypothetical protein [Novosphingobium profundi]
MIRVRPVLLASLTFALAPASAHADPIKVDVEADWHHAQTKFVFAPQVSRFERIAMKDYGNAELDVTAAYSDGATQTEATVYLFHAGLADASVWHDRILAFIERGELGTLDTSQTRTSTFTPPSGQPSAGIRSVGPLSGTSAKSTGIAIYPFADWLLAVRMTSHSLDPDALDVRLSTFVEELSAPRAPIGAPKAYPILACTKPLPNKAAKFYKPTMMDALLGATINLTNKDETYDSGALPPKDADWCRDPSSTSEYGVYRSKGTRSSYIVAVGDSGTTASVGRETLSGAISGSLSPSFQMTVRTVDHAYAFPRFTRLPAVSQVVAQIYKGQPISSATRGSPDTTITLPSGLSDEEAS